VPTSFLHKIILNAAVEDGLNLLFNMARKASERRKSAASRNAGRRCSESARNISLRIVVAEALDTVDRGSSREVH
jgi:hypothetical protein